MRSLAHAAWILLLAAACSSPSASLIGTNTGSSGSTSGGSPSTSSGGSGSSSGSTTSSGTGSTTGAPRFSCDLRDGGLFGDAVTVSTGLAYPSDWHPIDVGDLDGDGNLDIVITDLGSGDVVVMFGNGDGTFKAGVHSQVPAIADGGYGPVDLRIAAMGSPPRPSVAMWNGLTGSVFVASVQPTGELDPIAVLDAGLPPSWGYVPVADFNGDGVADCAGAYEDGVTVFLGDDAGAYVPAPSSLSDVFCYGNCVGDFNEDGIPDLLVLHTQPPLDLFVHLGTGDGTFSSTGIGSGIAGHPWQSAWLMGDLNEDGHLDALICGSTGFCNILLGNGDGSFSSSSAPALSQRQPSNLNDITQALRDLNGDGHLDYIKNGTGPDGLVAALGNGDGTFQQLTTLYARTSIGRLTVGDVNNDGRPDLIVSHQDDGDVTLFLNNCR